MHWLSFLATVALLASQLSAVALAGEGGDWSYNGRTAPQFWGQLNAKYSACGQGKLQSPVNFASSLLHMKGAPEIHMPTLTKSNVTVSKHTIQWTPVDEYKDQRYMVVKGEKYQLAQFHIHTPSEHHVDGFFYDAEIHFVHKTADGKLAVLGVFIEETKDDNPAWMHLLTKVPGMSKSQVLPTLAFLNEVENMPAHGGFFHYLGSLTTPPCSEGVQWFVAAKPLRMSMHQINAVAKLIGFSARPVQFNTGLPEVQDTPKEKAPEGGKADQHAIMASDGPSVDGADVAATVAKSDSTAWFTTLVLSMVGVAIVAAAVMAKMQRQLEMNAAEGAPAPIPGCDAEEQEEV